MGTEKIGYGDSVLYRMCKETPEHTNPDIISGKMWLIGRAYAASPERRQGLPEEKQKLKQEARKANNKTDSSFFADISTYFADRDGPKLDALISNLEGTSYEFCERERDFEVLMKTLELVKSLNEAIIAASNKMNSDKYGLAEYKAQNNISFASKYLHFHLPEVVFICDQHSQKNAKTRNDIQLEIKNYKKRFNIGEPYIGYSEHILRCYFIANELNAKKQPCSPRVIDNILMSRQ